MTITRWVDICIDTASASSPLVEISTYLAPPENLQQNSTFKVARIGLNDTFAESGDEDDVYDKYGMSVENIVATTKHLISEK